MSNENNNFVAPVGEINLQGNEFTAPSNFESRERNPNIQLLPMGNNLGVVYAIVDLGTHMESFGGGPKEAKRKIKVIFEHPQLKQQFYMDDPNLKSTVSSFESTFNVGEKSKLRALIHAAENRALSNEEANNYNIANLLGKRVNVTIEHNQSKKDATKFYEKIKYITTANGMAIPADFQPENPYLFFIMDKAGKNFMTKNFADLPFYLRKKIMESQEAQQYIGKGGKFAENPKTENNGQQQSQPQSPATTQASQQSVQPSNPPANTFSPYENERIKLVKQDYTIEQWKGSGWTEDTLVKSGHAVLKQQTQPQPPQSPPAAAPAPMAPPQANDQVDFGDDEESDDLPF